MPKKCKTCVARTKCWRCMRKPFTDAQGYLSYRVTPASGVCNVESGNNALMMNCRCILVPVGERQKRLLEGK
jgi:hypothetical protein